MAEILSNKSTVNPVTTRTIFLFFMAFKVNMELTGVLVPISPDVYVKEFEPLPQFAGAPSTKYSMVLPS